MNFPSFLHVLRRAGGLCLLGAALVLSAASAGAAERIPDPKAAPNDFLEAVANNMLDAVKADPQALRGEPTHIAALVRRYALPYVDMNKTTRLAAGRYWRQASAAQQQSLVQAFTGTLIRTYSGAFTRVTAGTTISVLPFRGDPKADDAVVRTTISQPNSPAIGVDYRLERTDAGWKVYDLNVEGIWLIQNYRNQFAAEIGSNGIDGLIKALNAKQ
ncbi:MlaC/ttg2D family ABC transporter substrate-binding protein [Castellaniella defragrans]|uniref:Phospholipid transport system substrate-binding protein n=1 Tax=Castellaniella defragrans TaxID=75697 RepID=A0A7W9TNM7_CASDE|nr:ABC transporter substrate-binding protein [Castellaniella defragrans]KAB0614010.1 ABC transporter substrate-binding protein [Castellaniella defragrans]MBB6084045.1 phospholipid transport system substrate-binding protein [Castellaniella defragrans]